MQPLTLWYRLPKGTFFVQDDLLVLRFDQVIHDMRRRCVASGVAEPFGAMQALRPYQSTSSNSGGALTLTTDCGLCIPQ